MGKKLNITFLLSLCNFIVNQMSGRNKYILILWLTISKAVICFSQIESKKISYTFLGENISIDCGQFAFNQYNNKLTDQSISNFIKRLDTTDYSPIISAILDYRNKQKLDDWLFYQLIRKTAQQISPKADNYNSYTLYKWFFLVKSGYDALLRISENKLLFYVQCNEILYNIPFIMENDKQYVCLNYHDYGNNIDFEKEHFHNVGLMETGATRAFTYKINQLPDMNPSEYIEKDLQFTYYQNEYHFKIKLNPEMKTLFINYPTGDYSNQFNIPLSKETYQSLIPQLKNSIIKMGTVKGVDYLMRFTRYAFLFEKDIDTFGVEKRLTPEETLLYDHSDCEDRAALFFCLVKEIYNLPMIVLVYPQHVTVAVEFEKPVGETIVYNGKKYSVCEPTPQRIDLPLGKQIPSLRKKPYEVAFEYSPINTLAANFNTVKN